MDSSTSTYHQKRGHMFFLEHSVHLLPSTKVCVHASKVELAAAGVHPVGMISSHASV